MEKMIAYCGLICSECGAFIATQKNDDEARRQVAEMWSKEFNAEIKPEDINCYGCLAEGGDLFGHCKVCEIRKCAKDKHMVNCGFCEDYPCETLDFILNNVPDAKKTLDEINKNM